MRFRNKYELDIEKEDDGVVFGFMFLGTQGALVHKLNGFYLKIRWKKFDINGTIIPNYTSM